MKKLCITLIVLGGFLVLGQMGMYERYPHETLWALPSQIGTAMAVLGVSLHYVNKVVRRTSL